MRPIGLPVSGSVPTQRPETAIAIPSRHAAEQTKHVVSNTTMTVPAQPTVIAILPLAASREVRNIVSRMGRVFPQNFVLKIRHPTRHKTPLQCGNVLVRVGIGKMRLVTFMAVTIAVRERIANWIKPENTKHVLFRAVQRLKEIFSVIG